MAGLPQNRPIPGAPLLDPLGLAAAPILPIAPGMPGAPMAPQLPDVEPLTGLPMAPPPELQGYQFDAAGEPLPFPPDDWFATPEGQPAEYQGQDVPVVESPPPAQEPPATAAAGPQGLAALDQARRDGHVIDPYADQPAAQAQPAQARGTGDAYLDTLNEAADVRSRAAIQQGEAEKQKNLYLSEQGTRIAQQQAERQAAADKEYQEVATEAKAKRGVLEKFLLQRMEAVSLSHPLDGVDAAPLRLDAEHQTCAHQAPVEHDAAGAAVARGTPFLAARE